MKLAADTRAFLVWLITCGSGAVIVGFAVNSMLDNLAHALACASIAFIFFSRAFDWQFEAIIGLPTVEEVRRREGRSKIALTKKSLLIGDLENYRSVYRFFQASIYVREARDVIASGRSRELIAIILGLFLVMLVIGYALLGGTPGSEPPEEPLASLSDTAWRVMMGLVPLLVHVAMIWIPLVLQQARHQKL